MHTEFQNQINGLPPTMTLIEYKDFLESDSEVVKSTIIGSILQRENQGQNPVAIQNPLDKVRIMSFHSSKGLDAKVVFIPGLEETVFPTLRTQQVPGLLLENARLFYVAITRAKAACILTHASRRSINGRTTVMNVSRFAQATGIQFVQQQKHFVHLRSA